MASYIRIAWAGREELIFIHGAMREARVWEISDRTGLESHAFLCLYLSFYPPSYWGLQTAQNISIMNKTMLVLLGKQSTGKTQTLKALISRLGQFQEAGCVKSEEVPGADNDCRAVFSIASPSGRAVKVAVLTAGDTKEIINDNLSNFLAEGADIIVCACRMEKEKRCWLACKGFADNNGYGLHIVSNISTWHDGRTNAERPLSGLYPFWDAYSAEALLLTVMHLVNEAKEE